MSPLSTNFWITFRITDIISWSLVLRAAEINTEDTFYWDDQLRNNWQNLRTSLIQKVVGSHNSEGTIGVQPFSTSVEEYRQIMMIIEGFSGNFPDKFGLRTLVVDSDRKISSIIVSPKV